MKSASLNQRKLAPETALWVLAALLTLTYLWMLNHYVVNFPMADDFTQILAIPGYFEHTDGFGNKIAYLFSFSGSDHRIATLRAIAWVQAVLLGGFNFRALVFLQNAMCISTGVLLLLQIDREFRPYVAPLCAALLFSPSNYVAQYWPSAGICHYGVLTYALFSLYCVTRPQRSWQYGAVVLALLATFTLSNGILVWPAGILQLWLQRQRGRAVVWCAFATICVLLYFNGYITPADRPSVIDDLAHPFRMVHWFLIMTGSM
ncbi:MAG TPA: hypothetical protein VIL19_04920, partial [Casimicrobiaceae bacterium]